MQQIKWAKFTAEERKVVRVIADRALLLFGTPQLDTFMDISAVHAHTPLRLEELADADQFNFTHDIRGIERHLDRETGLLTNHFCPRFARHIPQGMSAEDVTAFNSNMETIAATGLHS